jgi:hypothetical protein
MPATRKERDSIGNDAPPARSTSMYQMRESLQRGLPSPPKDQSPSMPSRVRRPPIEDIHNRRLKMAGRHTKSSGSLTFANSINYLPRAGSSRRLVTESLSGSDSSLGNSWSNQQNSKWSLQELGQSPPTLNDASITSITFPGILENPPPL